MPRTSAIIVRFLDFLLEYLYRRRSKPSNIEPGEAVGLNRSAVNQIRGHFMGLLTSMNGGENFQRVHVGNINVHNTGTLIALADEAITIRINGLPNLDIQIVRDPNAVRGNVVASWSYDQTTRTNKITFAFPKLFFSDLSETYGDTLPLGELQDQRLVMRWVIQSIRKGQYLFSYMIGMSND